MPRNGSGTYNPPVNSWSPATNGVPATASDWQSILNDIRDALTQSVSRDGQTIISGDLQMGGNKLTNLDAGSLPGDSLAWQQLFSQGIQADIASAATVDIGAQNTTNLNITGTTAITSFGTNYNGPRYIRFAGALTLTHSATLVLPGAANITTAAGDCAIVVPNGSPVTGWRVAAYERASGQAIAAPSSFPASGLTGTVAIANGGTGQSTAADAFNAIKQSATETASGVVELATAAEAQSLTDATRSITPFTLAQSLKGSNQTLAATGYQKFPGGLFVQWGNIAPVSKATNGGTFTVTFPSAFSSVFVALCNPSDLTDGSGTVGVYVNSLSTTGFTAQLDNSDTRTATLGLYWVAIGT